MAQQVCVILSASKREELAAIAADRNRPRKHIERAQIILASADRHPVHQVAQSIGISLIPNRLAARTDVPAATAAATRSRKSSE